MVAELLRLRLRILANGFRRPPLQVVAIVVGLLVAIVGVVLLWQGAAWVGSLQDDTFALAAVMFVTLWRGLGWYMVMYLAALQSVPAEMQEAAILDGASRSTSVS